MAGMPQLWNWLEDRRGKNDKMSRWVWEAVEDEADKARIVEAKGKRTEEEIKDAERKEERV